MRRMGFHDVIAVGVNRLGINLHPVVIHRAALQAEVGKNRHFMPEVAPNLRQVVGGLTIAARGPGRI